MAIGTDENPRAPILYNDDQEAENLGDDGLLDLPTGCAATACCNPSHTLHRFIALIFMCLLGFGSYFCYDTPGALQDNLKADLNITTTQFTWLYSIYSWPNVILCFIGGFLMDSVFGIRLGTILFMAILLFGQIVFATGGYVDSFNMMIAGRFIFGVGAESLAVAQNNYAVLWFKGKELNMVFGLQLSFARIGSTVNFQTMEPIYKFVGNYFTTYEQIGVVLYLATLTCIMSMICALVLGWMDFRAQRILRRVDNPNGEVAKLSDVTTFKITFWMVSVICVAYYVAIFPFIALGKVFFMTKFGWDAHDANSVNSILYLIAGIASPAFGYIVDKTGRNVSWVIVSILTTIGSHTVLAFTMLNPYVAMVSMGLSYSMLASSLWPLVALIVPEYQLGTAYGICQSVQNLGLAVISLVSGHIVDEYGYIVLMIFYISWLILAFLATIVIWVYNIKTHGILNMTPWQREQWATQLVSTKILAGHDSVEDITADEGDNSGGTSSDPAIRNRYLKRVGVSTNNDGASDCEPLLD